LAGTKNDLVIDKALAGIYTKVFDSAEGKRVLTDLVLRFKAIDSLVPLPSHNPAVATPLIDPLRMAADAGAESVVLHILAMVEGNKVGRFREVIASAMSE